MKIETAPVRYALGAVVFAAACTVWMVCCRAPHVPAASREPGSNGDTKLAETPPVDVPCSEEREPSKDPAPGPDVRSGFGGGALASETSGEMRGDGRANDAGGVTAGVRAELRFPAQDLTFRASVSRQIGRVPPEVDELIQRHVAGATPAELEQWARTHPSADPRVRLAVTRWLSGLRGEANPVADTSVHPSRPLMDIEKR